MTRKNVSGILIDITSKWTRHISLHTHASTYHMVVVSRHLTRLSLHRRVCGFTHIAYYMNDIFPVSLLSLFLPERLFCFLLPPCCDPAARVTCGCAHIQTFVNLDEQSADMWIQRGGIDEVFSVHVSQKLIHLEPGLIFAALCIIPARLRLLPVAQAAVCAHRRYQTRLSGNKLLHVLNMLLINAACCEDCVCVVTD